MPLSFINKQTENSHKVIDAMVNYWWNEIKMKMLIDGLSFEIALEQILDEILNA